MTPERQEFFKSKAYHWGYHVIHSEVKRMKSEIKKHKAWINEHKKQPLNGAFDVAWSLWYINKLTKRLREFRKQLRYLHYGQEL